MRGKTHVTRVVDTDLLAMTTDHTDPSSKGITQTGPLAVIVIAACADEIELESRSH